MKIDVSDLFDDLFAVATVAYPRFRNYAEGGFQGPESEWGQFCSNLSNTLFLPACAARAYDLLSERIDPESLKRRIITQRFSGLNNDQGLNVWYSSPRFFWFPDRPNGFTGRYVRTMKYNSGEVQEEADYEFLARPQCSLTLYLGKLPPYTFVVERPPYDVDASVPKAYYCQHKASYFISGPRTFFYETHGNWCLREVELTSVLRNKAYDPPRWLETDSFTQIEQGVFDLLWSPGLSNSTNWQSLDALKGWTVTDDYEQVKKAHFKRHPRHWSYTPANEVKPLTQAESEAYDALNENLHEQLRRVSKEHFADTQVPKELQSDDDDESCFTPFTYQDYDWYGPSYECYIVVIGKYVDSGLLKKFQSLLVNDHQNWCIQVVVSESYSFVRDHEISVFSDQIILCSDTAAALSVPIEH